MPRKYVIRTYGPGQYVIRAVDLKAPPPKEAAKLIQKRFGHSLATLAD